MSLSLPEADDTCAEGLAGTEQRLWWIAHDGFDGVTVNNALTSSWRVTWERQNSTGSSALCKSHTSESFTHPEWSEPRFITCPLCIVKIWLQAQNAGWLWSEQRWEYKISGYRMESAHLDEIPPLLKVLLKELTVFLCLQGTFLYKTQWWGGEQLDLGMLDCCYQIIYEWSNWLLVCR